MILLPLPEGSYRFTQSFGERPEYYKKYGYKGHNGYDLAPTVAGTKGVLVYAPHDGYVHLEDEGDLGYGRCVVITSEPYNHQGNRRKSYLGHLSRFLVDEGQFVGASDRVGIMGNTGDSYGIHVHWTYKIADRSGATLDKDNGFGGALPIAVYTRLWVNSTLQ